MYYCPALLIGKHCILLDNNYWNSIYKSVDKPGWDAGEITTPIKGYIDQLTAKDLKILVPGAGNAYEVEYLFANGFRNVYLCDYAELPVEMFRKRNPDFPADQILQCDFFQLEDSFDLILEQTFFTSIQPADREQYAAQMHKLLVPGGKLAGLLFNHEFNNDHPPFGAYPTEYLKLFKAHFEFLTFETAINSISPRAGRELFVILKKSAKLV